MQERYVFRDEMRAAWTSKTCETKYFTKASLPVKLRDLVSPEEIFELTEDIVQREFFMRCTKEAWN